MAARPRGTGRMEPYDADRAPAGEKPAATTTTATTGPGISPSQATKQGRLQPALTAEAAASGPVIIGMVTPTRLLPAADTPPMTGSAPPGKGCTTEELRIWVIEAIRGVGRDAMDLEVRASSKISELQAAVQDVATKVVTQNDLMIQSALIDSQFKALTEQANGFVTNLDHHLQKLEHLEAEFKGHVETNFLTVEKECNRIKEVVQGVYEGSGKLGEANAAAIQIQYGHVNQQVTQLREPVQAENVSYRQELFEIKNEMARAHMNLNLIKDSVDRKTAACSSNPGEKCHCEHLEILKGKVEDLERRALQQPQEPPTRDPYQGRDPWHNWQAPGSTQAPRAPQGLFRAPPGFQQSARRPLVANQSFPEMTHDLNRLFDDKIAISVGFTYDGEKHGEAWKRKVRGYWIAKCPDILPILNYAEDLDSEELTVDALLHEAGSYRWMTEINVKRLGELIWGFLNACLSDKARTCFEGADPLNGFDAWRRVVQHIHQGANVRMGALRRLVKNPPQILKMEDIDQGIVKFEAIMKDYRSAGGTPPCGAELKNDLLETLPMEIREGLMWRATEVHETFGQFTAHVRSTANAILFHRGKATSSLNNVGEALKEQNGADETYEDAIMAVNRKFNRTGGAGGGGRPGGAPGGADDRRGPRCVNCGGEHLALRCPKPRVEPADRPCYICGKPKHIARDCPEKKNTGKGGGGRGPNNRSMKSITEDEKEDFFGCIDVDKDKGFKTVPMRRPKKPQPAERNLGSFMPPGPPKPTVSLKNSFSTLTCRDRQCRASSCQSSGDALASLPPVNTGTGRTGRPGYPGAAPSCKTVAEIMRQSYSELGDGEAINITEEPFSVVMEEEDNAEEHVLAATEEREVEVAADTGAVAHCAHPRDLPSTVKVDQSKIRNFIGVGGGRIKHFGSAKVRMQQENGKHMSNNFQVMDVCRPLHSISTITDNDYDMLFTKKGGTVVPAGVFDEIMATVKRVAEYPRKGGLYVAKMIIKDPDAKKPSTAKPATFAGQGASR